MIMMMRHRSVNQAMAMSENLFSFLHFYSKINPILLSMVRKKERKKKERDSSFPFFLCVGNLFLLVLLRMPRDKGFILSFFLEEKAISLVFFFLT
ncbi:hypothetical protein CSUI_005929 [Cystoisospora suis]|uniref:Transmembrane protein n=1 Tax=Cystoisospora suis TaxID=483139 RepID=A0A2C6KVS8_9APIC|nr:hypothetical protein CSUI_005929 [Cystoisospora suis]